MRWLLFALALLVLGLQYRLWWGDGGRLELRRLQQQAVDYRRENALLRERNAALARQIADLKGGNTVLEQRAREELGLTREDELFYRFVEPQDVEVRGGESRDAEAAAATRGAAITSDREADSEAQQ